VKKIQFSDPYVTIVLPQFSCISDGTDVSELTNHELGRIIM